MAEGDGTLYSAFKAGLMQGDHDLASGGDTLKVTLHTAYTPAQTHEDWADVSATEYGTTQGYTAGGKQLGSQTVSVNATIHRGELDGADVVWTALGPITPATPGHAILWNDTPDTPLTDPLIGYWELGSTATNGGDYTLEWSTTPSAIILLT